jgi:hypothetical protein
MPREQLTEFLHAAITSLPQHLKAALRLMDDPDIPDQGRVLAAGSVMHWLSGSNSIPGVRGGPLSYVDDVLVLRLAYGRLAAIAPEAMARHAADSPELFGELKAELELIQRELGKGLSLLEKAVDRLGQLKHRGLTPTQCVSNEEAGTVLYEELQSALVDLDVDEGTVGRALKQLGPLLDGPAHGLTGRSHSSSSARSSAGRADGTVQVAACASRPGRAWRKAAFSRLAASELGSA